MTSSWKRAWWPCGLASILGLGCGSDPSTESGDTTSTTTAGDETTGTTTSLDSTGTGESTGTIWEAPLARGGITVDWVQANQGVGV
ncbi:MAG: hypothetical protein KDK70_29380, partial [Myxococcales bacterium]|nr:hypothetical protein [Myxococcales bacterium]